MIVVSGAVSNAQNVAFRVSKRSITFMSPNVGTISNRDSVTVAGKEKNGEIIAFAVRNNSTQALLTSANANYLVWGGGTFFLICIPFMFVFVGLLAAPMPIFMIYKGLQIKRAVKLIKKNPT